MKNDTHLNILMSYAYLYKNESLLSYLQEVTTSGKVNLMIDSGAFTKFNAKAKMSHVNVDDYCNFLYKYGDYSEKYVMLDVVGQAEQSKKNYELMLNRGLNPMFVATMFDKDFAYINHAVRHNPNLCVAGGVTTKGNWMTKRFQDIDNFTGHKAKIHGLGYVTFPKMVQLPLASVDSSTWKTAPATYGTMVYFDGKKISQVSYHDILRGKFKLTPFLKQQLDEYGVSPTMFAKVEHHKKALSIEAYMSMVFMNKLQKYCKRHNLDYFLAVGSLNDLQNIVYIDENINNLTYEKFLKNCN